MYFLQYAGETKKEVPGAVFLALRLQFAPGWIPLFSDSRLVMPRGEGGMPKLENEKAESLAPDSRIEAGEAIKFRAHFAQEGLKQVSSRS